MINNDERKAPVLRFKGFTDDWEQREFGDFWNLKSGKAYKASEYVSRGIPIINGETIKNGKIKSSNFNYLPKRYLLEKGNIILKPNDVVIGLNRPIINNQLKISTIPKNIPVSFLYQRAGKIESKFLNLSTIETYYLLERNIFIFSKITAIGSDQPFIKTSALLSWKFFIPKEIEVKKINELLDKISTLISLQQRKNNDLLNIKKTLLETIFPDIEGSRKIIISNNIWKKEKLKTIFNERSSKNKNAQLLSVSIANGVYPFDENERKNNSTKDKSHYKEVKIRDLAYNSMRMWQGAVGVSKYNGIVSPAYTVIIPKNKENPYFYYYYFKNKRMLFQFRRNSQGLTSDTWNLKFPLFKEISILTTKDTTEQVKIAKLLQKIDLLIVKNDLKISKLKSLKQFLLQNMFI